MCSARGLALLEVLLSIVLLAVVVGVCAPYLRRSEARDASRVQAEFVAEVNELIAQAQRQESQALSVMRIEALAMRQGWRCEPMTAIDPDGLEGRWVSISDGTSTLCRWARVETESTP